MPAEEKILFALKNQGYDWTEIATRLPDRTSDGCKKHWYGKYHNRTPKADSWHKCSSTPDLSRTTSGGVGCKSSQRPGSTNGRLRDVILLPVTTVANFRQQGQTAIQHSTKAHLPRLAPKPPPRSEQLHVSICTCSQKDRIFSDFNLSRENGQGEWSPLPHETE